MGQLRDFFKELATLIESRSQDSSEPLVHALGVLEGSSLPFGISYYHHPTSMLGVGAGVGLINLLALRATVLPRHPRQNHFSDEPPYFGTSALQMLLFVAFRFSSLSPSLPPFVTILTTLSLPISQDHSPSLPSPQMTTRTSSTPF
jgi:hypothetical protein